jgi:PAS domain S-box-containing protein
MSEFNSVDIKALQNQIAALQQQLAAEIEQRQRLEKALQEARTEVERRVEMRPAAVAAANTGLEKQIADLKRGEAEREELLLDLQRSRNLLRTVIDASPDWIFIKDREHRYQLVNQNYARSLNRDVREMIGQHDLELGFPAEIVNGNPEKGIRGLWPAEAAVMARAETMVIESEPLPLNGEVRYVNTIKVPLQDDEGVVWGVLGYVRDITEREKSVSEAQAAYRQYVLQEWEQLLSERYQGNWRVEYRQNQLLDEAADQSLAETQLAAVEAGRTKVVTSSKDMRPVAAAIVAPLALRGGVIGTLGLQALDPERHWSREEIALVETVSEQLAQTIENLRLFNTTQQRAAREQMARQITDKMRAAPTIDSIIETGLTELAQALGVSRTYVKLTTNMDEAE